MRKMLEHVRTVHDLDYIMITGDYPAHDVWLQSRYKNLEKDSMKTYTNIFQRSQSTGCPKKMFILSGFEF